jgi:uncharacterized protein (DUF58 family)
MTGVVDRVRVDRWSGALAGAVVLAVGGLLLRSTVLLVAAAIPVAYVVYGDLDAVDFEPSMVSVERTMDRRSAFPGDRVDVTVTVGNESDEPLADLRVVDDTPEEVAVVDGSDRGALSLRPGEDRTVEYTVVARRGEHDFGPVALRARSSSGTDVTTVEVTPEGATGLTCRPDLESVPLDRRTRQFVGSVATDTAGAGVEFHSTREYRSGDPISRIDWRRFAKSQDMTTVNYREHRSARVVVAVDARDPCYVSPVPGAPTAGAICGYGARRLFQALRDAGHEVGAAGFGLTDDHGTDGPAWVEPGTGEETRIRSLGVFDEAAETPRHLRDDWDPYGWRPAGPPRGPPPGETPPQSRSSRDEPWVNGRARDPRRAPDGGFVGEPGRPGDRPRRSNRRRPASSPDHRSEGRLDEYEPPRPRPDPGVREGGRPQWGRQRPHRTSDEDAIDTLCGRLPPETQLLLLTPALDEFPTTTVRTVVAHGHRVTVVSPDVTTPETTGGRLQGVERHVQLEEMRATGARVVDWDRNRPLALTLSSVLEGV